MNILKRFHWFELALIAVVMGVHLFVAFSAPRNFSTRWFTRDDAYYYFKVAQNISEGHGSTFDGINLTNGYHPLWLLVTTPIFALARFDLILPLRVLLVVMAGLSAASGVLLFRLLQKPVGAPLAMLAGAYWALDVTLHGIITQQGMETGLLAFAILALLRYMQTLEEKPTLGYRDLAQLALLSVIVLLSRLDAVYLTLLAGVWVIFRRNSARYLLPAELALSFALMVAAYIQRAELKFYLLIFTDSAMVMAAAAFLTQTALFYFTGLYEHPKRFSLPGLALRTLGATLASAAVGSVLLFGISAAGLAQLPRAVPALYWVGMGLAALLLRLFVRVTSPWQAQSPAPEWQDLAPRWKALGLWVKQGLLYYGILAAALLAYMGVNYALFETPMPVSGQIKRWWGTLPNDVYGGGAKSILDVYSLDPGHTLEWRLVSIPLMDWARAMSENGGQASTWYWSAAGVLGGLWLFLVLRAKRRSFPALFQMGFVPLFISAFLQAFLYGAMGYAASHEWYWVMQMLSITLAVILGLHSLGKGLWLRRAQWALAGVLSLWLAFSFTTTILSRMPFTDPKANEPYMDMLPILEGYTEPGSLIGMTGGGNAGYFIQNRTVVNMDGLINSYPYFLAVQNGQASQYLSAMGLDYVFANYYIVTETMPYVEQFKPEQFEPVKAAPVYGRKELLRFLP